MAVDGKQVFLVSLLLYIIWYGYISRRPTLYHSSNPMTSFIVRNCPSFHSKYYPLFLLHMSFPQMFITYLVGIIYPILTKPVFVRELFTLSDGQQIAMDWTLPKRFKQNPANKPIVIGLYGIAGDKHSLNILRICKMLSNRLGYGSVIVGRRGHEVDIPLTVPKMSAFGLQQDLHECLLYIHSKYPSNPFILLGDSAGTGFWVRYTADLALCCNSKLQQRMKEKSDGNPVEIIEFENAQTIHDQLHCAIMISPGYDTSRLIGTMSKTSKRLLLYLMKRCYISNHYEALKSCDQSAAEICEGASELELFYETYHGAFSGYESYEDWLRGTNPTETAEYVQCPGLIINARDDPICTAEICDQWKWLFTQKDACPNSILCETEYGSHSAFLSAFGGFWLDDIIVDYVKAVCAWRESRQTDR